MATNQPVSIANATDIREIAPPVEIPNGFAWLWWTLAALAILTTAALLWRWWRKRAMQIPIIPPLPAHVRAKQKLQEALTLITQPKPFVVAVSDAARWYLEERFNFRAPERTTEEFLHELQRTDLLTRDQKESLGDFLQSCDLVKFARYEPGEPELRDLHGSALRLVEETEIEEVQVNPEVTAPVKTPPMPTPERFTVKERFAGFAIAAVLILIGLATWLWPHLHLVPQEAIQEATFGRGGWRFVGLLRVVEFLWSRPLGTLLAVVGAFVLWGVLTKKYKDPQTDA